jgi:hypothetical protein
VTAVEFECGYARGPVKTSGSFIIFLAVPEGAIIPGVVEQLARWYRFLPTGDTKEQQKIMDRLAQRLKEKGGMTPALSERSATAALSILAR